MLRRTNHLIYTKADRAINSCFNSNRFAWEAFIEVSLRYYFLRIPADKFMQLNILKRKDLLLSAVVFLVCFLLRILYISDRDFALDEPFTLYYSQQSIQEIIGLLYNENNPPLHFIFLHLWIKAFGMSVFSVRLPSVIFSSFTAVMLYLTGTKFFNRDTGVTAAAILTLSSMHVFFAHEARVYPLFVLLTACSLFSFLSILNEPEKKSNYYCLFFANLFLIYSHYFGFYVVFIEAVSIFFTSNTKRYRKNIFILFLLLGVSYLPMLFVFVHRFGTSVTQGTWVAPPGFTEVYGNINRFINTRNNTAVLILLFAVSSVILYKKQLIKQKYLQISSNRNFKIVLSWFLVPYLLMFLVSFRYPMFIDRYILYTSIPLYLVIAFLLGSIQVSQKLKLVMVLIFLAGMAGTLQLNPDNNRRLKQVATVVKANKNSGTVVFIAPHYAYVGFTYHYDLDLFKDAQNTVMRLENDNVFPVSDTARVSEILLRETPDNCIYVQAGTEFTDPDNTIFNYISSRYKNKKLTHVYEIYNIYYFYN